MKKQDFANQKKLGVSFFEANEVFADELSSCIRDPDHSDVEERCLMFGVSSKGNFLVDSFTERAQAIRIISARPMIRQERNAYEQ